MTIWVSCLVLSLRGIVSDPSAHPLSPGEGDVAVSSFALFHSGTSRPSAPRAFAQSPPSHILAQQAESQRNKGMASLDAVADSKPVKNTELADEDDLFAVMVSPRSPEMTKSPFSFSPTESASSLKGANNQ